MGIAFSFLQFFDICHRRQALQSPLLALGSLDIHETEADIVALARKHSYFNFLKEKTVGALFQDRYGISDYKDCDLNEKADLQLDLSLPIGDEFMGTMSTILDGGTLEHVFDIRQAFANIHQMLRLGGTIIHISPLTWFNHAFYNFNPKLFKSIIAANKYELLVEGYWLFQENYFPFGQKKSQIYITYDGQEHPEINKIMDDKFYRNKLPAKILYLISYRKDNNKDFRSPYDM